MKIEKGFNQARAAMSEKSFQAKTGRSRLSYWVDGFAGLIGALLQIVKTIQKGSGMMRKRCEWDRGRWGGLSSFRAGLSLFIILASWLLMSGNVWAAKPQIAAGIEHTLAIKSDGTLWAWGRNDYGQIGDGTTTDKHAPVQIGIDNKWVAVSGGQDHSVALKSDGTLWAWGKNGGQIGDGTTTERHSPVQIGSDTNWVSVSAGATQTIAIKSDGSLWAWGFNGLGELGDGTTTERDSPVQIGSDTKWVYVSAGWFATMALKSDGTLWGWGYNGNGQLGDGTTTDRHSPVQIGSDTKWVSVAASFLDTIALKSDGTLWAWGNNGFGEVGDGTTIERHTPVQIGSDTNWVSIETGDYRSVAIKSDGTLWAWGNLVTSPAQIGSDTTWASVADGSAHTVALKSDGTLWTWGYNANGQLGDGTIIDKTSPVQITTVATGWTSIAAGVYHSVALKSDGTLWAWGNNSNGQLGDGTTTDHHTPEQIGSDTNWVAVAVGSQSYHTVALKADGTLWAWGLNSIGQLGDGTATDQHAPEQIGSDTNWVAVTVGNGHTMALKADGTLWGWGANGAGELGDGTTTSTASPEQIGSDTNWVAVAAGVSHTMALKADGTLWGWGGNGLGQLGDGTTTERDAPVQIGSDTTWVAVRAGQSHTLGLKADGSLWAWGVNLNGELGDGTTTEQHAPVQIGFDTDWAAVAAGGVHTLAIKSHGTLWAWGDNALGQLGDGTTTEQHAPEQIGSDTTWVAVAGGHFHSLGLKADGTLWAWGENIYGQLGDGTTTEQDAPVPVVLANTAPAADNQNVSTAFNIPVTISLSAVDAEGDAMTFAIVTGPTNGSLGAIAPPSCVVGSCTALITYTPDFGFAGFDSFSFKANDGFLDSNIATVYVGVAYPILSPIANPTVDEEQLLQFTVTGTEGGGALTLSATGLPPGATFTPDFAQPQASPATGTFSWTPDAGQAGTYYVLFQVYDGVLADSEEVVITVNDTFVDSDQDGVADALDNCPSVPNPNQSDQDNDGVGDVCDNSPLIANTDQSEQDNGVEAYISPGEDVAGSVDNFFDVCVTFMTNSNLTDYYVVPPDPYNVTPLIKDSMGNAVLPDRIPEGPARAVPGDLFEINSATSPQTMCTTINMEAWFRTLPPGGYTGTAVYGNQMKDPNSSADGTTCGSSVCYNIWQGEVTTDPVQFTYTGQADLIMTYVKPNAATVAAGGMLSVTDTVLNQGTGAARPFSVGYVLSPNTTYGDADDVVIVTSRQVGSLLYFLGPGASDTATTSLQIPAVTPAGTYHTCAKADKTDVVIEHFKNNNTLCSDGVVTVVAEPDLVVTSLTTTGVIYKKILLPVSLSVKNQGGVTAGTSVVAFHLSTDASYGGVDDYNSITSWTIGSLYQGTTVNLSTKMRIPSGIPSGMYHVCVKADSTGPPLTGLVIEGDENNNTRCTTTTVSVP
jgi:alpha-tubulin suppressor-like RCC1 family protein